jgi:hypothetical protein
MAYNINLIKIELTIERYSDLLSQKFIQHKNRDREWLPQYLIARCPYCLIKNIEALDTYSINGWSLRTGHAVYSHRLVFYHCQHFTLVQPFIHFHGIWPTEAKGFFGPEVPHVIGHLLDSRKAQAVIHALPICRIEENKFVPRFTVFIVSYYSLLPERAYNSVIEFNTDYVEPGVAWPFIAPPKGCDPWWDLNQWVAKGQLYWVDSHDPELGIRTQDVAAFPYVNIIGRTWPYIHTFPYPLPKKRTN